MINREQKEQRQREVAQWLHENGDYAVMSHDDTNIRVYVGEETDELSIYPQSKTIHPYTIDNVYPLPDDDHFASFAILSPDWTRLEDGES